MYRGHPNPVWRTFAKATHTHTSSFNTIFGAALNDIFQTPETFFGTDYSLRCGGQDEETTKLVHEGMIMIHVLRTAAHGVMRYI